MSVRGSLRTMSVEDLLDWIDRRSISGTLTVESSSAVRSFTFDAGYVIGAMSNATNEQSAQLLLRAGLVMSQALDQALDLQAESGTPLSAILKGLGAVDDREMSAILDEQTTESLLDTLMWQDGSFLFELLDESANAVDFPVSVRLRGCIVQGRQRGYRWNQIRHLIPQDDLTLEVVDETRLFADKDSNDAKESILELAQAIEAGWTIEQIVAHQYGRRYGALDSLAMLIERGAMAVAGQERRSGAIARLETGSSSSKTALPRTAATAGSFEEAARAHMSAGNNGKALELAYRALRIEPQNPAIQQLHSSLERSVFAELSRELLTSFRVPELLVARDELDRLELSGTERYLAGRVDGRWDLLSLMRVAPVREVEALITFKRLADRGIISL